MTRKILPAQDTVTKNTVAGHRTTTTTAEILLGVFAAKLAITLELERPGPQDPIVFSEKADTVLRVSIQVGIWFSLQAVYENIPKFVNYN